MNHIIHDRNPRKRPAFGAVTERIARTEVSRPAECPMNSKRAWIMFRSGRKIDLLNPDPCSWTDADLAIGLSRTYRWGGHSAWELPLSVAQHSLTVLAIRNALAQRPLTAVERLRELVDDGTEALIGGFDCITPLKPYLGPGYAEIVARLQRAIDQRYDLPPWTDASYREHKHADWLAAASEAHHVVGWRGSALRKELGIMLTPLASDPLPVPEGLKPWEPWPPYLAADRFLETLRELRRESDQEAERPQPRSIAAE